MGKIFLNSIQYCGGNGNSAVILHKYTATLTSSQYGWFTFVDENGNVIAKDSTKTPVLATALDGAKYYFGSFFVYEENNRYLFKVYDINDSSAHGYEGTSKTLTFDLTYVESSSAFGGHSYNTIEQVVGTWIDGSPVYEKVVDIGTLPNKTSKNVPHGISNLAYVISADITASDTNGNFVFCPHTVANRDYIGYQISVYATTTDVVIEVDSNRSAYSGYAILRYTKSA